MSGRQRWWTLGVAFAALGCGAAEGAASSEVTQAGPGMSAAPTTPPVDPAVSQRYSWSECGRIAPTTKPTAALYATDGSILVREASGRVRLFESGSVTSTTLVPESAAASAYGTDMTLSPDGRALLLAPEPDGAFVLYATEQGEPLSAPGSLLVERARFDPTAEGCQGSSTFSPDSSVLATRGAERLCVWSAQDGSLLASFADIRNPSWQAPLAVNADGVSVYGPDVRLRSTLRRYAFDGTLLSSLDLSSLMPEQHQGAAHFSPDGRFLLLAPNDGMASSRLLALDAATGEVVWEQSQATVALQVAISPDSSVVAIEGGPVLALEDGQVIGHDVPRFVSNFGFVLGPGGHTALRLSEQVREWDLDAQELLGLYGSHTSAIHDLDITPDGKYLASHGDWATVWQLDADDFSQSRPLFNGAAADESWNVAIDPMGSTIAVSGDNIAFFRRDGSFWHAGAPSAALPLCGSADFAFSPLGAWAAGTHYSNAVFLYDVNELGLTTSSLDAHNCNGAVAFSPDGSQLVTASLEAFETSSWTRSWSGAVPQLGQIAEADVTFSPDGQELALTRCQAKSGGECHATRYHASDGSLLAEVNDVSGTQVRYSPEGHWLLSANQLLHLPSGTVLEYAADSSTPTALFAPNGDIIAGELDGSLVRYCRASL